MSYKQPNKSYNNPTMQTTIPLFNQKICFPTEIFVAGGNEPNKDEKTKNFIPAAITKCKNSKECGSQQMFGGNIKINCNLIHNKNIENQYQTLLNSQFSKLNPNDQLQTMPPNISAINVKQGKIKTELANNTQQQNIYNSKPNYFKDLESIKIAAESKPAYVNGLKPTIMPPNKSVTKGCTPASAELTFLINDGTNNYEKKGIQYYKPHSNNWTTTYCNKLYCKQDIITLL